MKYIVIELQTNTDGTFGNLVYDRGNAGGGDWVAPPSASVLWRIKEGIS